VNFLVDMPLPPAVALWLREHRHDAVHAPGLGLDRAPDTAIIARAFSDKRTIVTADLDYPGLLALSHASEPSLVLFRGADWTEAAVIARMHDILSRLRPDEIEQSILVVDPDRIRRRRLPIG
jgi:predicted nuclease of predicted toxin-antitoxin system